MINLTGSEKLPITPAHQKNVGVILVVIVFHSVDLSSLSCSLTGIFVLYHEAAVFTKVVQVRYANHDCRYHAMLAVTENIYLDALSLKEVTAMRAI